MKKTIAILAAILMAISTSGQVKGIDLENVVEVSGDREMLEHSKQWVKTNEDGVTVYVFIIENEYAVDYKHLITELDRVLKANGLDIDKPDDEDDLLPPRVKGLRDYSNLAHYVSIGEAEIRRNYYLQNGWMIGIICDYEMRGILAADFMQQYNRE